MEIILPLIARWLDCKQHVLVKVINVNISEANVQEEQKLAMAYLWEATIKFPKLFSKPINKACVNKFRDGNLIER